LWEKRLVTIRNEMAPYQAVIDQLDDMPDEANCPTCGQSLADIKFTLETARVKVKPLQECIDSYSVKLAQRKKEDKALDSFNRAQAELTKEKKRIEGELAGMADVEAVEKVVDYAVESLSREESQLSTNLKTKRGELQTTIADREKLIASHKAAKLELEKMEAQLEEKVLTDKQFEEAGERLLKNDRNKSDLAASKALITEYTRVTNEKQAAIDRSRACTCSERTGEALGRDAG
jgi:hypothetical protein